MEIIHDMNDLPLEGRRTGAAVYAVERIDTGRRYVAASRNLSKRLWDATAAMKNRTHHNPALHADLVEQGPENFKLIVLELVEDVKALPVLRRLHIEHAHQSTGGTYNAEPPPARQKLFIDRQASEAVAQRRKQAAETSLNDAIDRMSSMTRRRLVDQIIEGWQQRPSR